MLDLQLQMDQALKNYQPDSKPVQRIQSQIDLVQETLVKLKHFHSDHSGVNPVHQDLSEDYFRLQGQLQAALGSQQALQGQLDKVNTTLQKISASQSMFITLQREVDVQDQNYRHSVQDYQSAQSADALNASGVSDVALIGAPSASDRPVSPWYVGNILLALLGGGFLGMAYALIAELMDDRLSTPSQLAETVGLPVLVTFPAARVKKRA